MKERARNFEFQQQLTAPPMWTKIFPEHRVCQAEVRDIVLSHNQVATTPTLQGILNAAEFGLDDTTDNSHDIICRPVSVSSMRSCRYPAAKEPTRIIQTVGFRFGSWQEQARITGNCPMVTSDLGAAGSVSRDEFLCAHRECRWRGQ
jgi:hypothetical protein